MYACLMVKQQLFIRFWRIGIALTGRRNLALVKARAWHYSLSIVLCID